MTELKNKNALLNVFSENSKLETGADGACITRKEWIKDGERHRLDGPALLEWDAATGVVIYEEWAQHGEFHRQGGPAIIERDSETGGILRTEWWVDGKNIQSPSSQASAMKNTVG